MPWKETDPMTERVQFMAAYLSHMYSMPEWCERFGIRRNTGDQWVRRYAKEGPVGLQEKSRAPHRCPHRISAEVEAALLEATRAHAPDPQSGSDPATRAPPGGTAGAV
jgi:putative transposase